MDVLNLCKLHPYGYLTGDEKMNLQHIIFHYLVEEETRPSLEDPAYEAAEEARDAAEQELKSALTGKQRRLLTEFRKREDELSLMQLRHMLSHCTLCLSVGGTPPTQQ